VSVWAVWLFWCCYLPVHILPTRHHSPGKFGDARAAHAQPSKGGQTRQNNATGHGTLYDNLIRICRRVYRRRARGAAVQTRTRGFTPSFHSTYAGRGRTILVARDDTGPDMHPWRRREEHGGYAFLFRTTQQQQRFAWRGISKWTSSNIGGLRFRYPSPASLLPTPGTTPVAPLVALPHGVPAIALPARARRARRTLCTPACLLRLPLRLGPRTAHTRAALFSPLHFT